MRSSPLLVLGAAACVLLPASATATATAVAATGNWSAAATLTAAGSGTPEAFITPQGRSLVLTSDGSTPLLASGDATGAFGAPAPVGGASADLAQVDGAVGPDGSFAVAWISGGAAHVALAPPGGAPGAPVDLPGGNAGAVAVTIGADGRTTVAYRTQDANSGFFTVSAATAAPGTLAFGDPLAIDSSRAGFDGIDVAASAGGTIGVTYRKLAPSAIKAYASVYHPGDLNFESPQAVSAAPDGDVGPSIVAGADGSFVLAWGNVASGPAYAVRPAGGSAFGTPLPLNPAGGDTSSLVDLASTPAGGAAAAWAGGGVVRVAGAPAGGVFGAPTAADTYGAGADALPAVTVAPDQTLTVVANHPADGSIEASDVGGVSQVIGAGAAGTVSPVAVASSATRTLAAWRNAGGGISVATRSPAAVPGVVPPTAVTLTGDRTPPKVTRLGAVKRVVFHKTPTVLSLKVDCSEACRVSATGRLSFSATGVRKASSLPTHPYVGRKTASALPQTVTLHFGTKTREALARAARVGRGANAFVVVTATDAAGNAKRLKLQITLRPAPKNTRAKTPRAKAHT